MRVSEVRKMTYESHNEHKGGTCPPKSHVEKMTSLPPLWRTKSPMSMPTVDKFSPLASSDFIPDSPILWAQFWRDRGIHIKTMINKCDANQCDWLSPLVWQGLICLPSWAASRGMFSQFLERQQTSASYDCRAEPWNDEIQSDEWLGECSPW